jgi:ectoine hydroxylase-related dioxygenase (phytanoyl-CoA dioxygenase family)
MIREHVDRVDADGYTIIENAFSPDLADELVDDLLRLENMHGIVPAGNGFEGYRTWRIYNLLALGRIYEQIPVHPTVLAIMHHVLGDGCLISSLSSISIGPDEVAQPIHADDQLLALPKPHIATIANSMWALTDFTEQNGATRVVAGSHVADHSPQYGSAQVSIPAEMTKGSILVWHGSLWHGGGANQTIQRRWGIAMNYCAGWVRQQENQQLGIPLDIVRQFTAELQELCGFHVYRGLIGHINKHSPAELLLHPETPTSMLWERT